MGAVAGSTRGTTPDIGFYRTPGGHQLPPYAGRASAPTARRAGIGFPPPPGGRRRIKGAFHDERVPPHMGKPLAASKTEMTEMVLPNETNTLGRALGGVVLHWMDICAAIAGMRFAGTQCVTASMDHVDFVSPIDLGEVAVIEAYVFSTGRTSLDVMVEVHTEDPREGERKLSTSSFFTFVAVDESGRPTDVPSLECPTDAEAALRETAVEERREQLQQVADRLEEG